MDEIEILCPWCGEQIWIVFEVDVKGEMVQDCEVCCQPINLNITRDEWGDPDLAVMVAE